MKISAERRSRIFDLIDVVTGLGLKVGIPVAAAATVYLLVAAFGPAVRSARWLASPEGKQFAHNIGLLTTALTAAACVVVASIVIRFFAIEAVGQTLALVGALIYFGSPAFIAFFADSASASPVLAVMVTTFRDVGGAALLPGLVLVLRDAILRIWTGVSVQRTIEKRWGDEEERLRKHRKPRFYGSCWDMAFCRDFVRRVCPAWEQKKPCWRVKSGCYCDERTILTAMTKYGADNEHVRGIMHSLGLDQPRSSLLNARQRAARCRRCGIYAEHQRQKYRLLSPMVFPLVGLAFYVFYDRIAGAVWVLLEKTDQFMRALTLKTGHGGYRFADQGNVLTALAMIWLGIIVVSYALRALEYLIFEKQV